MLLTSGSYLIFLALVFFVYWPCHHDGGSLLFLLFASYYFYALWNPWSLGFFDFINRFHQWNLPRRDQTARI